MLDPNVVRENTKAVKNSMKDRGMDSSIVDDFIKIDEKWRKATTEIEGLRAEKKKFGKDDIKEAKGLKDKEKKLNDTVKELEKERSDILEQIPSILEDRVPRGKSEDDNKELKKWGDIPEFDFEVKDYLELAGAMIDTERAAKVSGARFGYILGDLALLEFALIKYTFEKLVPHGFAPVLPPVLIRREAMKGMGKRKFIEEEGAYYIPDEDLYLVATAEDAIGPMHMDEKFKKGDLPKRYAGFSTAFRKEAGSYGKDTKGILRVHQFDKIEMFAFTDPQDSVKENDFLLELQEELMQGLELPYRVVHICSADTGFTATNQFDIEAWMPSEGEYRETHSCSNTTDFQARGLNIKTADGEYAHMLNATALAIGRTLIAIIENNQTKEGKIKVPKVLQDYVGKKEIENSSTS